MWFCGFVVADWAGWLVFAQCSFQVSKVRQHGAAVEHALTISILINDIMALRQSI
jgi:hypothetical protein